MILHAEKMYISLRVTIMTLEKKGVFSLFILGLSFSSILSCTIESSGISVKTYREPVAVIETAEQQRQDMMQAIQRMNQVTENSVFTEKTGVPEYIVSAGDVIAVIYWTPSRDEGFKQNTYTTTVRPDGKISFIFGDDIVVGGRTCQEIDDNLTELARKYMRDPRFEVIVKEYKSKSASLFGQINILQQGTSGPGKYPLLGKTRVLDLIVTAGGVISG